MNFKKFFSYRNRVNIEHCASFYDRLKSDSGWMNIVHSLVHDSRTCMSNLDYTCGGDKTVKHYYSVCEKILKGLNIDNADDKRKALLIVFADLIKYLRDMQGATCSEIRANVQRARNLPEGSEEEI